MAGNQLTQNAINFLRAMMRIPTVDRTIKFVLAFGAARVGSSPVLVIKGYEEFRKDQLLRPNALHSLLEHTFREAHQCLVYWLGESLWIVPTERQSDIAEDAKFDWNEFLQFLKSERCEIAGVNLQRLNEVKAKVRQEADELAQKAEKFMREELSDNDLACEYISKLIRLEEVVDTTMQKTPGALRPNPKSLLSKLFKFVGFNVFERAFLMATQVALQSESAAFVVSCVNAFHCKLALDHLEELRKELAANRADATALSDPMNKSAMKLVNQLTEIVSAGSKTIEVSHAEERSLQTALASSLKTAPSKSIPFITSRMKNFNFAAFDATHSETLNVFREIRNCIEGGLRFPQTDREKLTRQALIEKGNRVFSLPPNSPNALELITQWTELLVQSSKSDALSAIQALLAYTEKFGKSVPPEIHFLLYTISQNADNLNYQLVAARAYEKAIAQRPHLAKFPQRYRAVRLLGRGAFGPVFHVQSETGIESAIKIWEPKHKLAFLPDLGREIRNLAKAASVDPTGVIVRINDADQMPNGSKYFLMEHVKGATLASLMSADKRDENKLDLTRNSLDVRIGVFVRLVRAIAFLHRLPSPIIHRDLHPNNIMIAYHGAVRIIDFGLSKQLTVEDSKSLQSIAGQACIGAPDYTAPEVKEGNADYQRKPTTDVYALGRLGALILTGKSNFEGLDLPPQLTEILRKATSFDPNQRYADAEELRTVIEKCFAKARYVSDEEIREWIGHSFKREFQDPFEPKEKSPTNIESTRLGRVRKVTPEGIILEADGENFFVPATEISWTKSLEYLPSLIDKELKFLVVPSETKSEHITSGQKVASIRRAYPDPWQKQSRDLRIGKSVKDAVVLSCTSTGLLLKLNDELNGLLASVSSEDIGSLWGNSRLPLSFAFHVGDKIPELKIKLVDNENRLVLAAIDSSPTIAKWKQRFETGNRFEAVISAIAQESVFLTLDGGLLGPVAVIPSSRLCKILSCKSACEVLGRKVLATLNKDRLKGWPNDSLIIDGLEVLSQSNQQPLLKAKVISVDPIVGGFAIIETVSSNNTSVKGRLLVSDYSFPAIDDLRSRIMPSVYLPVRKIRVRANGEFDYCVPNLFADSPRDWLPNSNTICRARVVRVEEHKVFVLVNGFIPAYITRTEITTTDNDRSKSHLLQRQLNRLNLKLYFQPQMEIDGYVLLSQEEKNSSHPTIRFIPKLAKDKSLRGAYVRSKFKSGTTVRGQISNIEGDSVRILVEPGIEGSFSIDRSASVSELAKGPSDTKIGRVVRVDVGEVIASSGELQFSNLRFQRRRRRRKSSSSSQTSS